MNSIKKHITFSNILFTFLFIAAMTRVIPSTLSNIESEGTEAADFSASTTLDSKFSLSQHNDKLILIFWATWCGPCAVELNRINKLIESGAISPKNVLALSSHENPDLVRQTVKEKNYRFQVGVDPDGSISAQYKVNVTPTLLFINQARQIEWRSTGISPLLELRAKNFLKSND